MLDLFNKIRNKLTSSINEITTFTRNFHNSYGSKKNQDKAIILSGTLINIFIIALYIWLYYSPVISPVPIIVLIYIFITYLSAGFSMIAMYFFLNEKTMHRFESLKRTFLYISLLAFLLASSPALILVYATYSILNITKFKNVVAYFSIYCFCFFLNPFSCLILFLFFRSFSIKINFNPISTATFFTFVLNYFLHRFIIYLYFCYKKNKERKLLIKGKITQKDCDEQINGYSKDYIQSKNELYILNFLVLAVITFVFTCVNLDGTILSSDMLRDISAAFALFIAFDRLYDKWKKTHNIVKPSNPESMAKVINNNKNEALTWLNERQNIYCDDNIKETLQIRGIYGFFIGEEKRCVYIGKTSSIYGRMFCDGHIHKLMKNAHPNLQLSDAMNNGRKVEIRILLKVPYQFDDYHKDMQRLASAETFFIDFYQNQNHYLEQVPEGTKMKIEEWENLRDNQLQ